MIVCQEAAAKVDALCRWMILLEVIVEYRRETISVACAQVPAFIRIKPVTCSWFLTVQQRV